MKITGLYLAAGHSLRMGMNKLSLPFGDYLLGMWALEKAIHSQLDEIIIISNQVNALPYKTAEDEICMVSMIEGEGRNQSDSIKAGLDKAIEYQSDAIMILLADQPFISTKIINQLINIYKQDHTRSFVAPLMDESMRPPILLSKTLFKDLYKLEGDQGAKQILMEKRQEGVLVPFLDRKIFVDIDTIDEYLFWTQNIQSMSLEESNE